MTASEEFKAKKLEREKELNDLEIKHQEKIAAMFLDNQLKTEKLNSAFFKRFKEY